jgi:DNA-binding MarR family transcriptional regulator
MIEQYRSGQTVYELTPVFGITRQTAGIILRRHGVLEFTLAAGICVPRHRSLTTMLQVKACLIYLRRNRTQADIAETLEVSQPTVSRVVCE